MEPGPTCQSFEDMIKRVENDMHASTEKGSSSFNCSELRTEITINSDMSTNMFVRVDAIKNIKVEREDCCQLSVENCATVKVEAQRFVESERNFTDLDKVQVKIEKDDWTLGSEHHGLTADVGKHLKDESPIKKTPQNIPEKDNKFDENLKRQNEDDDEDDNDRFFDKRNGADDSDYVPEDEVSSSHQGDDNDDSDYNPDDQNKSTGNFLRSQTDLVVRQSRAKD